MKRFNVCGAAALVAVAMVWAGGVQAQVVDAVSGKPVDEAVRTMIEEARFARTGSTLAASKAISVGCVPRPLPTELQGQTWSAVVNDSFLGMRSQFRMTAWRYACSGGDGQQLLLTLEPTHGATNLTGNFHVRQGFRGYNVIPVIDDSRTPLGSSLSRETTVMLSYVGSSSEAFDDDGELELRYVPLGSDDVVLQIPAAAVTPGEEVEEPAFLIDGRVRGSYTVEGATGHGMLFDVVDTEAHRGLYGAWFTSSPVEQDADRHAWFTLGGEIEGDSATLDVYHTSGQRFGVGMPVETRPVGTAVVVFASCTEAHVDYDLHEYGRQGQLTLLRITPAPEGCEVD